MKKIITVLLTFSLLLSMTACGGTASTSSQSKESAQNASTASTAEDTQNDTREDAQEAVQQAAQADTQDPTVESTVESPNDSFVDISSSAVTEVETADESSIELGEPRPANPESSQIHDPRDYDTPFFDFSIEALERVPEENKDVSIENVEFFTAEDGSKAMRVFFLFKNNSDEKISFNSEHSCYAIQDEEPLGLFYGTLPEEEYNTSMYVEPGKDIACACSFTLNTESPAAFVVTVLNDDLTEDIPVVAKIIEIKNE